MDYQTTKIDMLRHGEPEGGQCIVVAEQITL